MMRKFLGKLKLVFSRTIFRKKKYMLSNNNLCGKLNMVNYLLDSDLR